MALPADCASTFELIDALGGGGFGTVYRCRHRELRSLAAVKVMRRDLAGSPEQVERFLREARIAASLKHPHVVGVLDAGAGSDPWIAFEYVEGRSLEDRLAQARLTVPEALDLGIQIASALELAHANGVVHRDIKPANVLQAGAAWKLADFGIAHTEAGRTLTAAGVILGTPAYIDPLYVQGGEVSPQSDLYALGAVLYEAVTGVRAIPGDEPLEIVTNAVRVVPLPASSLAPEVPPRLDALLARMLAKSAAERFPDASALLQALGAVRASPERHAEAGARRMPARRREAARSPAPEPIRTAPGARAWTTMAAGALAIGFLYAAGGTPRPGPTASPVAVSTNEPAARAVIADLKRIRSDLAAAIGRFRTARLMDEIGPQTVINPAEAEEGLVPVALRLLSATERARDAHAPPRAWAWLANQLHDLSESVRYFPTAPNAAKRFGGALVKIEQAMAQSGVYAPLAASSVRCALTREKRAETAGAEACERVHGRVAASPGDWSDPGERAGFLLCLTWRQMHHERRARSKSNDRPALTARLLEHGELLAREGSAELVRFDALAPALVISVDVAREHPPADVARRRALMGTLSAALEALPRELVPPEYRDLSGKTGR